MEVLRQRIGARLEGLLRPVAQVLATSDISPNHVTMAGLVVNVVAAWLITRDNYFLAGALYLLGGGFDVLDGMLARATNRVSVVGAYLDSTLDRISEGAVPSRRSPTCSLARARPSMPAWSCWPCSDPCWSVTPAPAPRPSNVACKVGIATRPERVVLIALGLMTGWLAPVVYLLAVLTGITRRAAYSRHLGEPVGPDLNETGLASSGKP